MTSYALLVGLNYPYIKRLERDFASLAGCHQDVVLMKEYLLSRNYNPDNIYIITDSNDEEERNSNSFVYGTKHEIVATLLYLIQKLDINDTFLFHFSGHGFSLKISTKSPKLVSNSRNTNNIDGDGLLCSSEKYDSSITANTIFDFELFQFLSLVMKKGVKLTLVLDTCNSFGFNSTIVQLDLLWATLRPQSVSLPESALLLAACGVNSNAREYTNQNTNNTYGCFTASLLEILKVHCSKCCAYQLHKDLNSATNISALGNISYGSYTKAKVHMAIAPFALSCGQHRDCRKLIF